MLVANLDSSDYLGRIAIGRVFNGRVKIGDPVAVCKLDRRVQETKVTKLFAFEGLRVSRSPRRPPATSSASPASRTSRLAKRLPTSCTACRCRSSPSTSRPSR
jgi:hypothetical protein